MTQTKIVELSHRNQERGHAPDWELSIKSADALVKLLALKTKTLSGQVASHGIDAQVVESPPGRPPSGLESSSRHQMKLFGLITRGFCLNSFFLHEKLHECLQERHTEYLFVV